MNNVLQGTKRVLIVEDDLSIRSLIRAVLRRDGLDIDEAGCAADALSKLRSQSYDAVVLDLMLPDGHGMDVLHEIRALPSEHHCVVVISAASPTLLEGVDDARVRVKLRKPFDIGELSEAVRGCLTN